MKTKIVCYVVTLICASLSIRAFANCEAGAYMIHTVAEYKPTGTGIPILKYIIEKDIFKLRIPTNPEKSSPVVTWEAKQRVAHANSQRRISPKLALNIRGLAIFKWLS